MSFKNRLFSAGPRDGEVENLGVVYGLASLFLLDISSGRGREFAMQLLVMLDYICSQTHARKYWRKMVKPCSQTAPRTFPFGNVRPRPCSRDVKKETQYDDLTDNSCLQLQNVDEQFCEGIDYIQAVYPSVSQHEPTDEKSYFIEASSGQADSNATSFNLSDMLALDDEFSSADSKKIETLFTVAGYRVKTEVGPTLRGILTKYGDNAANCKKSIEFRSLLLETVCEIVRKLGSTEFLCLTTVEIDSFRLLLKDMELDVDVGWLLQRLDELSDAKKLLKESPIVKLSKKQKESETIAYETEIQRLQEKIKHAQTAMELRKRKGNSTKYSPTPRSS